MILFNRKQQVVVLLSSLVIAHLSQDFFHKKIATSRRFVAAMHPCIQGLSTSTREQFEESTGLPFSQWMWCYTSNNYLIIYVLSAVLFNLRITCLMFFLYEASNMQHVTIKCSEKHKGLHGRPLSQWSKPHEVWRTMFIALHLLRNVRGIHWIIAAPHSNIHEAVDVHILYNECLSSTWGGLSITLCH